MPFRKKLYVFVPLLILSCVVFLAKSTLAEQICDMSFTDSGGETRPADDWCHGLWNRWSDSNTYQFCVVDTYYSFRCAFSGWSMDFDCDSNTAVKSTCTAGCQPWECEKAYGCTAGSGECVGSGSCDPPCPPKEDYDCGSYIEPYEGCYGPCQSGTQCPSGETCVGGECVGGATTTTTTTTTIPGATTTTTIPGDCANPTGNEYDYTCHDGYVKQCENTNWEIIVHCSTHPSYDEPCDYEGNLYNTALAALKDCSDATVPTTTTTTIPGECDPGDPPDAQDCPYYDGDVCVWTGTQERICEDDHKWGDWGTCEYKAGCDPGTTKDCNTEPKLCKDDCKYTTTGAEEACCEAPRCWDSSDDNCVANGGWHSNGEEMCINGNFITPDKQNPEGAWGTCYSENECLVTPPTTCVSDGYFTKDYYCENGDWTSRTKFIALQLIRIADGDYIIFCDNASETLNYLEYHVEGTTKTAEMVIDENAHNNFCVLIKGNDDVVFGTPLGETKNEDLDEDFLKALNIADCTYSGSSNEFYECSGSGGTVWYNPKIQSVIYSKQPLNDIEKIGSNFFETYIKGPFGAIFNYINSNFFE